MKDNDSPDQIKHLAPSPLSTGQCATLACLLEVAAPKPGNVHRGADFEDLFFQDFLLSAVAIAPAMEAAPQHGLGRTVRDAVAVTRSFLRTNTNLGMVLLMAPLAAAPAGQPLQQGVKQVLHSLTRDDAHLVYEAIRRAQPGGLGKVQEMDVSGPPPDDLLAAMTLARDRDLVARQYVEDFALVLQVAAPILVALRKDGWRLTDAIIHAHVVLMSRYPDTLIARKCGPGVAQQSADRAAAVLKHPGPHHPDYLRALSELDFWLRSDHHRRNPGATADLIAAALFACLRDGSLPPPFDERPTDGVSDG